MKFIIMKQVIRTWQALLTLLVAAGLASASVAAQGGGSLSAERTVEYKTAKTIELKAQVGPVKVHSVEFQNLGRGYGQGGFSSKMRGGGTGSEVTTTIRSHFLVENPDSDEWEVTFVIEYLDKNGKVIDRVTKKSSWEGEAKPFDFDHQLLEYVLPAIDQVKIKLEARKD
jgi:hypothetical protein